VLLKPEVVERAVDLQKRSYALLRWVADHVDQGSFTFQEAHRFASLPEAAHGWLDTHYETLPRNAQPAREDLRAFANLFASYLETSFDMLESPGQQLYSPANHCFCPICSWLVNAPRLVTKKLSRSDKGRARDLQCAVITRIAKECGVTTIDPERLLDNERLYEAAALVAYGLELEERMKDAGAGRAGLALWRAFAWTRQGSPKHGFELTPQLILDAETALAAEVRDRQAMSQ